MSQYTDAFIQDHLNRMNPAAHHAHLGDVTYDIISKFNDLVSKYNDLVSKFDAFLAHVDAGNVTGIGNTNVATYGASADSNPADVVALPGAR